MSLFLNIRAQADTEKNSLVDGNTNIQITPKRRESTLDIETTRDPNEGIMQDNPLHVRMECYVSKMEWNALHCHTFLSIIFLHVYILLHLSKN